MQENLTAQKYVRDNFLLREKAEMKIFSNLLIQMNSVDFFHISEYIERNYTLAKSHRLAWLLESTEADLRTLGVIVIPYYHAHI